MSKFPQVRKIQSVRYGQADNDCLSILGILQVNVAKGGGGEIGGVIDACLAGEVLC
jgi:hypothetical protein